MLVTIDLDEIQRLADEATPGPWHWTDHRVSDLVGIGGDEHYSYETEVLEATHGGECGCRSACILDLTINDHDRAFIAAARTAIPALVARVRELEAENRRLCERAEADRDAERREREFRQGFHR